MSKLFETTYLFIGTIIDKKNNNYLIDLHGKKFYTKDTRNFNKGDRVILQQNGHTYFIVGLSGVSTDNAFKVRIT
jgi:hypothetical protein